MLRHGGKLLSLPPCVVFRRNTEQEKVLEDRTQDLGQEERTAPMVLTIQLHT